MNRLALYLLAGLLLALPAWACAVSDGVAQMPLQSEPVAVTPGEKTAVPFKAEPEALKTQVLRSYAALLVVLGLLAGALYLGKRKGWLPMMPGVTNAADIEVLAVRQVAPQLKVALLRIDGVTQRVFFNEHAVTVVSHERAGEGSHE